MELVDVTQDPGSKKPGGEGRSWKCKCPRCGFEMDRTRDTLCESVPCPKCGAMMRTSS